MDQLRKALSVKSTRIRPAGQDENCVAQQGDNSKKLRDYRMELARKVDLAHRKHFNVEKVGKLAKLQGILCLPVFVAALAWIWAPGYYIALEESYVGFWAPLFSVMGTASILLACRDLTYAKLHWATVLETAGSVGWLTLVISGFVEGIPKWRTMEMEWSIIYLILTSVATVIGLVQLVLSVYLAFSSGQAMCKGRSKLEGKWYSLEIIGDYDDAKTAEPAQGE